MMTPSHSINYISFPLTESTFFNLDWMSIDLMTDIHTPAAASLSYTSFQPSLYSPAKFNVYPSTSSNSYNPAGSSASISVDTLPNLPTSSNVENITEQSLLYTQDPLSNLIGDDLYMSALQPEAAEQREITQSVEQQLQKKLQSNL